MDEPYGTNLIGVTGPLKDAPGTVKRWPNEPGGLGRGWGNAHRISGQTYSLGHAVTKPAFEKPKSTEQCPAD